MVEGLFTLNDWYDVLSKYSIKKQPKHKIHPLRSYIFKIYNLRVSNKQ